MDFSLAPAVVDSVQAALARGDLGYAPARAPASLRTRLGSDPAASCSAGASRAVAVWTTDAPEPASCRLNFGTSRELVVEAVRRMAAWP